MNFRRNAIFSALLALSLGAHGEIFFSGETGIRAAFSGRDDANRDSGVSLQGHFSGQLSFTRNIFARGEFSLKTGDISKGPFDDTDALVSMSELSLTYTHPAGSAAHIFTAFVGNADPIGKDAFLRHQFGIAPFTPHVLESYAGADGIMLYPLRGMGASYTARLRFMPLAAGVYIYKNDETAAAASNVKAMPNLDLRLAMAARLLLLDFAGGLGLPLEDDDSNEDAFLYIKRVYLHAGLTALVGNRSGSTIFIQAGFSGAEVTSSLHKPGMEQVSLVVEPRLRAKGGGMNITLFNLPAQTVFGGEGTTFGRYGALTYIDGTLGMDLMIYADSLSLMNSPVKVGVHAMASLAQADDGSFVYLDGVDSFSTVKDALQVKVAPFAEIQLFGGSLGASLHIKPVGSPKFRAVVGFKKTI